MLPGPMGSVDLFVMNRGARAVTALGDNGVWIATTEEHHASLLTEFPAMRSISVLGSGVTGWQVLPADAPDFEEAALHACALIHAGDPRIGKIHAQRRVKRPEAQRAEAKATPKRSARARMPAAKKTSSQRIISGPFMAYLKPSMATLDRP